MFLDENSGTTLRCPYCRRALEPRPCGHFIVDRDPIEALTSGPWSEWLEEEVAVELGGRFARLVKSGKQPPATLAPLFNSIRDEYGDEEVAAECIDAGALIDGLLEALTAVADVRALGGSVESGPGASSSGSFYFAADPDKAERQLLALIRSRRRSAKP